MPHFKSPGLKEIFLGISLAMMPGCSGSPVLKQDPAPGVPASASQEVRATCFAALEDCLVKVRNTEAAALMAQTTASDIRASVRMAWKTSIAALSALDDKCPPGSFFNDPTYREKIDKLTNAQRRTSAELRRIR